MELNKLPKTKKRKKKRVGRGYGSGKGGHTAGRGAKGLKARSKVALTFEGTKFKKSFLKKLPLQRGKGKFKTLKPGPLIVNLKYLNLFSKGSEVDLDSLVKKGIVKEEEAKRFGVKILGNGKLEVGLKVKSPCSKGAAKKIQKAGGQVILEKPKVRTKETVVRKKTTLKTKPTKPTVKKTTKRKPARKNK